jgi:hypothetical protein
MNEKPSYTSVIRFFNSRCVFMPPICNWKAFVGCVQNAPVIVSVNSAAASARMSSDCCAQGRDKRDILYLYPVLICTGEHSSV